MNRDNPWPELKNAAIADIIGRMLYRAAMARVTELRGQIAGLGAVDCNKKATCQQEIIDMLKMANGYLQHN